METELSSLEKYEVIALGTEAKTVRRALRNIFVDRKNALLNEMASASADPLTYAKIAGRVQEWMYIERVFELRELDGEEMLKGLDN